MLFYDCRSLRTSCLPAAETVLHETAHLCGPWPTGTPHNKKDGDLYKRIEACAVEIAGSK